MENIFMKTSIRQSNPIRLSNLSPQKYGKAAYDQNRSFTPSKLADNVLYRQVTTLKKVEEGNGKVRQFEAFNSLLKQRLAQAQQQKQGIQKTLNQQIIMYKKMLKEKQEKNQIRLKEIQHKFRQQIRQIISEKQQEAKYFQSQKQIYQDRMEQLQNYVAQLNNRLNNQGGVYNQLKSQKQKVEMQVRNIKQRLQKMQIQKNFQIQKLEQRIKGMNEQFKQQKNIWKVQMQGALHKKDIERKSFEEKVQGEIYKKQFQKKEVEQKLQEQIDRIQSLRKAFDSEIRKHVELINMKENIIQRLNRDTGGIKSQLMESNNENGKLHNELNQIQRQNRSLALDLKQCDELFMKQKANLISVINQLNGEIHLNQLNYVRQKERNELMTEDNIRLQHQSNQRQVLLREITQIRELLMQSSRQIERCRQRFMLFDRQNKKLRCEMERLGGMGGRMSYY